MRIDRIASETDQKKPPTVTKKDLVDRIAAETGQKRVAVKKTVQSFLDAIVLELARGNRLEFRDFGVFEIRVRAARKAHNPRTKESVYVGPQRTVKFKVGRLMREQLEREEAPMATPTADAPISMAAGSNHRETHAVNAPGRMGV
ncbi:MAG: integration host factor subunit beta [Phycisphaerales bacterium]|nr:integration host factor subunit beta [Phycisphaerales bacterium]